MTLPELIADLRLDLSDAEGAVFTDATLTRCLRKAVYKLASDAAITLTLDGEQVLGDNRSAIRELLLLRGHIHACQVMRAATANTFSFASGDKRVDKSKQPEHWAKLEVDLWAEYRTQLAAFRPATAVNDSDALITPAGLTPVIYEQGSA